MPTACYHPPPPKLQSDMRLALGFCFYYAQCTIFNFIHHCWLRIVVPCFTRTNFAGNIGERPEYDLKGIIKCILQKCHSGLCQSSWNCTRDSNLLIHWFAIFKDFERNTMLCTIQNASSCLFTCVSGVFYTKTLHEPCPITSPISSLVILASCSLNKKN